MITSNGTIKCPNCGSGNLKYSICSASTRSTANYYHIKTRTGWLIPSWQRTYKRKKDYKSVALCQDCGYCFEPYPERGLLFYLLCLLILPLFLGYLFFTSKWFKENKKKFFKICGIAIFVCWILIIMLYFIGINLPDTPIS